MDNIHSQYQPDDVSPPGETLLETLEVKGVTQAELAIRMGRPKKTINEIIKGKTAITPETALQLELALGIPASFWNERERRFQEALARTDQNDRFAQWVDWLNNIPYEELASHGWIQRHAEPRERVREVLQFFGVVSPEQWAAVWDTKVGVSFRRSATYADDHMTVAAWLRRAELIGQAKECAPYEETAFRRALEQIRGLTRRVPTPTLYHQDLVEMCAAVGVAVTLVPRVTKSRVFGACEWLSPRKALIALSDFYKSDDNFWFSLFHEIGHILLHSKKGVFLDQEAEDGNSPTGIADEEAEADNFARDFLIPPEALEDFVQSRPLHSRTGEPFFDPSDVCAFAERIGVAPSIVVGRLQYDGILEYKYLNQIKSKLEVDDDSHVVLKKVAENCY